jgi:hypothetical protein
MSMAISLLDKAERVCSDIKRNVIKISSENIKLKNDFGSVDKAINLANKYMSPISPGNSFYYTTAVEYPFSTEPYLSSRYSDGTFPVWYGSKTVETTVYETGYHFMKKLLKNSSLRSETLNSNRAVYSVFCDSVLISLLGKEKEKPELISKDYEFTQKIAKEIKRKGISGLISPSARRITGINYNIFEQSILSNVKHEVDLNYEFNLRERSLNVKDGTKSILNIKINIEDASII